MQGSSRHVDPELEKTRKRTKEQPEHVRLTRQQGPSDGSPVVENKENGMKDTFLLYLETDDLNLRKRALFLHARTQKEETNSEARLSKDF